MQEPPVMNPIYFLRGWRGLRPSIEFRLCLIRRTSCFVKLPEDNLLSVRRVKSASNRIGK